MGDPGGSHHDTVSSGPGAPVTQNSPQRGDPVASPPWELANSPLLVDTAVYPPFDEITAPLATTQERPAKSPRNAGRRRVPRRSPWSLFDKVQWPLVAILTVQAGLSLRLVWTNTAFVDEATYLWAGHIEWAHLLHGTPVPAFATYFSGAPVIYPPLGAIADSLGGLAGARLLSLAFMLGATLALWGATSRLYGRRAAMTATVLFALLGPTEYLGAFATYDAMALFLTTVAAWCLIRARDQDDSSLLLMAGIIALVLANATKYATAVFDPSVAALGALVIADKRGMKAAAGRFGCIIACTIALAACLLALGGSWYLDGIQYTTTSRTPGTTPAPLVLSDAAEWVSIPCVIALAGVALAALSRRRTRASTWLVFVLASGGLLVPLQQARIHTTVSLAKQVDYGAWFAAIAAGYAVAFLSRTSWPAWVRGATTVPVLAAAALPGWLTGPGQAMGFMQGWANSAQMTAMMSPLVREYPGRYLVEDYDVFGYYLRKQVSWQAWLNTWYFTYKGKTARVTAVGTQDVTGLAAYDGAIRNHYFALIALNFGDTAAIDDRITADIRRYGGYHVVAELPYLDQDGVGQYTVWARTGASR
jgi:4-amino-4-deoxy-L-arabinose transferase-like glycosyltransferase